MILTGQERPHSGSKPECERLTLREAAQVESHHDSAKLAHARLDAALASLEAATIRADEAETRAAALEAHAAKP